MGGCNSTRSEREIVSYGKLEDHLSGHTKFMLGLVTKTVAKNQQSLVWLKENEMLPPTEEPHEFEVDHLTTRISLPTVDPDFEKTPLKSLGIAIVRGFIRTANDVTSFDDANDQWESLDAARAEVRRVLGPLVPPATVQWYDFHSDDTLRLLATQGYLAQMVEKCDEGFCIKLNYLQEYEVRKDMVKPGCDIFWNKDMQILRINIHGKDYFPDPQTDEAKKEWHYAKFVARSTGMAAVTLRDHLGYCHYMWSNSLCLALGTTLPCDSPLRRLMHPHVFMTAYINENGWNSLLPEGGLFHRGFPWTYKELLRLIDRWWDEFKYETLPDMVQRTGIDEIKENPWVEDGLDLWHTIHKYVEEYINHYYKSDDLPDEVHKFWKKIEDSVSGSLPALDGKATLIDAMTQFIWIVSGYHENVGRVVEYMDPEFFAPRWRENDTVQTPELACQIGITAALTGLRMPGLVGEWGHILPADAKFLHAQFMKDLNALSERIKKRNESRKMPFFGFDPPQLEVSVSI